ncbi:MAG TPA: threonine/serine dehydratase [Alphaproteobacteria bacterium]|nr:threonine/serine dehydratase [Alphaproteobacteria bacterium]
MNTDITRERIAGIEPVIRPYIRRTPTVAVNLSDFGLAQRQIRLKLEFLQHSGSFKARGVFANLLTRRVPKAGVVAASGGNHGVAVAYGAMKLGIPATIFLPTVASPAKIARIRSCGAELVITGDRYADALAASEAFVAEREAMVLHAYDQVETMLGQGTVGLEVETETEGTDTLIVAVGGGGLIGGIAAWFAGRTKIIAVEPEEAPTLFEAFAAGHPVDAKAGGVAADSLAPKRVGELMFPLAQAYAERPILVSDAEILAAQAALWDAVRVVAEPGGAAALAAVLSGKYAPADDERVTVLVCGANTTAVSFSV